MKVGSSRNPFLISVFCFLTSASAFGEPPPSMKPDGLMLREPSDLNQLMEERPASMPNDTCSESEKNGSGCIDQTASAVSSDDSTDGLEDLLLTLPDELRARTTVDQNDPLPQPDDISDKMDLAKDNATVSEEKTETLELASDIPIDANALEGLHILSSVRFGSYTKPLLTCRGRILNEEKDQYGAPFALEMEGQTLKSGAIPAGTLSGHMLRFVFDLAPSQGDNTCARYNLKSDPRKATELIADFQGQRFAEVEVNSREPLFFAFVNLQVESAQKSVGRWRETFGFVNDVYRFGRKEAVWADGFTITSEGFENTRIEFEPAINFPQELILDSSVLGLAQENTLGIASKIRFESIATQIAEEFLHDHGEQANHNRFLYVSDEFASCDDFHSDLSRVDEHLRTALINNGTFVISVRRMPSVTEGESDIGIVRQCAAEPGREDARVFAFHGRERAMNLDWAEALARVEAELRKTPFFETSQESEL